MKSSTFELGLRENKSILREPNCSLQVKRSEWLSNEGGESGEFKVTKRLAVTSQDFNDV